MIKFLVFEHDECIYTCRSNSSACATYLRFMLLSILEFWNTVHDFPSIIYHSLESLPSVSCFHGHEERTGLSVLNSSIQEIEKGETTQQSTGTKLFSQAVPHKPTENRDTELEIHTHFVKEKYTYFKGLVPSPLKRNKQKNAVQKQIRSPQRTQTLRRRCDGLRMVCSVCWQVTLFLLRYKKLSLSSLRETKKHANSDDKPQSFTK